MPRGDVRIDLIPPIRGLRSDLPIHKVPDGFLSGGENVLCRDGVVLVRPGMTTLTATAPTSNRIMGGIYYVDHTGTNRVVIGTAGASGLLAVFNGTSWSTITGATALTGSSANQVRFSVFPFSNTTKLLCVNDVNVPQVYTGTGTFADLGGSPPIAKAITTAFQRIILGNVTIGGTRRASSLWISGFQDSTVWDSANEVTLSDTKDNIVEVQALNSQTFAIYKDRSQWVGIGAGNLFPFVFELRAQQPGPVSPGSVVQAEDSHYYIGQDGDVYHFNGSTCVSIGGAIKRTIQADLDFNNQAQTHGFYDRVNREIWWFWPTLRTGVATGGIVYRLGYGDYFSGTFVPPAFSPLMSYALTLTASLDWRDTQSLGWNDLGTYTWDSIGATYPTWDSFNKAGVISRMVFGSDGTAYRFGSAGSDAGQSFSASWDFPMRAIVGTGENTRVDVIESFFKRAASSMNASIVLLTSNTLADTPTTIAAQTVDIGSGNKLRATYTDNMARFVGIRHTLTGAIGLQEYRGGVLYTYRRGEQ